MQISYKYIPTIKEKVGMPQERAKDLQPYIDSRGSEKVYEIKVTIKKSYMTSNVNPKNLTYYN